jgi:hypothetical protein
MRSWPPSDFPKKTTGWRSSSRGSHLGRPTTTVPWPRILRGNTQASLCIPSRLVRSRMARQRSRSRRAMTACHQGSRSMLRLSRRAYPSNWMELNGRSDGGGWDLLQEGWSRLLPFIDGDVEEGSTYAYRLRVCWNQGGCSAWVLSDPESITVAAEEEGQPEALSPPGSGLRDTPW